jgi:hypothetical protein
MCTFQVSGGGKGYVGPDKKAQEVAKAEAHAATQEAESVGTIAGAAASAGDSIRVIAEKIGSINPEKFKDFFEDKAVSHVKSLVDDMAKTSRKDEGDFAHLVQEFEKSTSKMDNDQLLDVAQYIGEKMKNTDGHDALFGVLLESVLDKIDRPAKGRPAPAPEFPPDHIWDEKFPPEKHYPWDEKLPGDLFKKFEDKGIIPFNHYEHKKVMIVDSQAIEKDIF